MQVKGTKVLMGKEAKLYQDRIDYFRGCLHQCWL